MAASDRFRSTVEISLECENGTTSESRRLSQNYSQTELGTQISYRSHDLRRYQGLARLHRAALMGAWEVAEAIFNYDSEAIVSRITLLEETALHVAVGTGKILDFVKKLVSRMCEEWLELALQDSTGNTALAVAAIVGNVKAAKILVGKNQRLPLVQNNANYSPLLLAAKYGHKDMISYLLPYSYNDEEVLRGNAGAGLLNLLIKFDFYDIALRILNLNTKLAIEQDHYGVYALQMLAEKPDVFEAETQLGFWPRLLHRCGVIQLFDAFLFKQRSVVENPPENSNNNAQRLNVENPPENSNSAQRSDVENPHENSNNAVTTPCIKNVCETRRMQLAACELVRCLCEAAMDQHQGGNECANYLFSTSILSAARMGTLEVAMAILRVYPYSIWFRDSRKCNIFQLAVLHRQHKIYNLIYQMTSQKYFEAAFLDNDNNNILHLAGELVPSNKISGPALQFLRELQWFKEVEGLVQPSYRNMKNNDGKTPRTIFSERHDGLVRQGEKWMKITASSCTVVAALIATVAFSAIFTVPGGNNSDQGIPIFLYNKSFKVFAIADALALITSSSSIMTFLGILTSRYAEDDFLKALPTRLIIGLVSLFMSISTMVAAFGASIYLVLVHQMKLIWVPVIIFSFIPIVIFAVSQFPLLVQIISSTYGRSIFGLQSKEILL